MNVNDQQLARYTVPDRPVIQGGSGTRKLISVVDATTFDTPEQANAYHAQLLESLVDGETTIHDVLAMNLSELQAALA